MINIKIKFTYVEDIQKFVYIANGVNFDVDVSKGRYVVDGKSLLGLFTFDLSESLNLTLHTDDEKMVKLFSEWIVE